MRVLFYCLAWAIAALMAEGCASGGTPRFWRDPQRGIVVAGPMLGPAQTLKELAPQLCATIGKLPGATARHTRGGQEYCGAIYQRNSEKPFYASYPSTLGPPLDLAGAKKACYPPHAVDDPSARSIQIYADYHSHPAITRFSPFDLQSKRQLYYFRVMFNPICEVYLYDFQARTVLQLRDGEFIPIKQVTDDERGE